MTILAATDPRGVARVTLNRPEVKNAFNDELIRAIADAIARLGADPAVRVIVLTGAGDAFSAGADLSMMKSAATLAASQNRDGARVLADMLHAITMCGKPVVALVNGAAMGGGVGLVAACDIAIAAEEAFFALSEARLGLIPAVISPHVVRAIGARQARRYFLTGERFDAETARRIGLVHMVALRAQLEATLDGVVKNLLACGPVAQKEAKDLIRAVAGRPIDDSVIVETAAWIARVRASPEGIEGITAFLEKRKPGWMS
jgi:methylglutaconyl-CoA hydratase